MPISLSFGAELGQKREAEISQRWNCITANNGIQWHSTPHFCDSSFRGARGFGVEYHVIRLHSGKWAKLKQIGNGEAESNQEIFSEIQYSIIVSESFSSQSHGTPGIYVWLWRPLHVLPLRECDCDFDCSFGGIQNDQEICLYKEKHSAGTQWKFIINFIKGNAERISSAEWLEGRITRTGWCLWESLWWVNYVGRMRTRQVWCLRSERLRIRCRREAMYGACCFMVSSSMLTVFNAILMHLLHQLWDVAGIWGLQEIARWLHCDFCFDFKLRLSQSSSLYQKYWLKPSKQDNILPCTKTAIRSPSLYQKISNFASGKPLKLGSLCSRFSAISITNEILCCFTTKYQKSSTSSAKTQLFLHSAPSQSYSPFAKTCLSRLAGPFIFIHEILFIFNRVISDLPQTPRESQIV